MDEKRIEIENVAKKIKQEEVEESSSLPTASEEITSDTFTTDPLEDNSGVDWQTTNETTPHRKTKAEKRKRVHDTTAKESNKRLAGLNARRGLFSTTFQPKSKYPPKGKYQLGNIYERIFKKPCENLHRAETDVMILTKLILHYGLDFLAYAEERKISFDKIQKLGNV